MPRFTVFQSLLFVSIASQPDGFCSETPTPNQTESEAIAQAQSLISSGRHEDAQNLLLERLRRFPRSTALLNLAGIEAAEHHRNQDAENAFLMALKYSPNFTPALLNLARVFHAEEKEDLAIETYQRALRVDNGLTEAHANLAALMLERKDYQGTLKHLSMLNASIQHQNRYLAIRAAAQAGTGSRDLATETSKQMDSKVREQDVSLPVYVLGQLNESSLVINISKQVPLEASSKEFRGLIATAYAATGELAKARLLYESVARDDPFSIKPLLDAAHVAYNQHDFEGTAGYLIHAVKMEPENADAQFFLGIVCVDLSLPGDAVHALREAVRLKPDNAAFNYALGSVLLTSSDRDSAMQYFKKYVQLRPDDPHGKLAIGIAQFEIGDLESAQKELVPLVNDLTTSGGARYILGRVSLAQDDFDGAEKYFTEAAATSPQDATIYAYLGSVYIQKGNVTSARKALERALEIDSDNYLANENLLILLQRQKDPAAKVQANRFAALTDKKSKEQQLLLRHIDAW